MKKKKNKDEFFIRVDDLWKVMLEITFDEVRDRNGVFSNEDYLSFLIDCLINLNESMVEGLKVIVDEIYSKEDRPSIKGFLEQVIQIKTPEDFRKKLDAYIA